MLLVDFWLGRYTFRRSGYLRNKTWQGLPFDGCLGSVVDVKLIQLNQPNHQVPEHVRAL